MNITFQIDEYSYEINVNEFINIAIPLSFKGEQPNVFRARKASAKACETKDLIGDTRLGGSCNFEE